MPNTCEPCATECSPQELARSVDTYRASVLQILCSLLSGGIDVTVVQPKSAVATETALTVTNASSQIYAGGDHNGAFLYNPNPFPVWVSFVSPVVAGGPMELEAEGNIPLRIDETLYTGPVYGIHTQVGNQTIYVIKAA